MRIDRTEPDATYDGETSCLAKHDLTLTGALDSEGHCATCVDAVRAHVQRTAHAQEPHLFTPDRFTDVGAIPVTLSRVAEHGYLTAGPHLILPQHSVADEATISAELVACTLGHRSRPELVHA